MVVGEWKEAPAQPRPDINSNAGDKGDVGSISELERSPRGGYGNPLQYSCLEIPMDRGAWWATVQGLQRIERD